MSLGNGSWNGRLITQDPGYSSGLGGLGGFITLKIIGRLGKSLGKVEVFKIS